MIAKGDRSEQCLEPAKGIPRMGTPVHEVPDPEQPITSGVEPDFSDGPLKGSEAAVYVTQHEVPSSLVESEGRGHVESENRGGSDTRLKDARGRSKTNPPRPVGENHPTHQIEITITDTDRVPTI